MLSQCLIPLLSLLYGVANAATNAAYTANNALIPSTHGSINRDDSANILPKDSLRIFYESPFSRNQPTAAFLTFSGLVHKTVALEHISSITSVSCARGVASITFANLNKYSIAQNYWLAQLKTGLVIVTYSQGCGAAYPEQRSWLKVKGIRYDDERHTVHAEYDEVPPEKSAETLDIEFGQTTGTPGQLIGPRADISKSFKFDFTAAVTDQTSFGAAHLIGRVGSGSVTTSLYCVGCGASGAFTAKGSFSVKLLRLKLEKAELSIDGSIKAQLALAIVGAANKATSFNKQLVRVALSSFSIPALVAVGPYLTLDVGAEASLTAVGGIEYGWSLTWPAIKGTLDLKDFKGSASGFTPTAAQIFDTAGKVGVNLSANAKLGVHFGVDILKGKWEYDVALVDQPSITLDGKVVKSDFCYTVGLGNKVYLERGSKTVSLADWKRPSASKCVK